MHTKKTQTAASAFRAAFPLTLPVMAGYIFLGMTYGILMVTSGFPVYYPILTAVVVYTGSMEFLLVSILLSPYHPAACFLTALMVGARHLFYGISMLGMNKNRYGKAASRGTRLFREKRIENMYSEAVPRKNRLTTVLESA